MNISLENHWQTLVNQLGKTDVELDSVFNELNIHYNEPNRYYHNQEHIEYMLNTSTLFNYSIDLQLAIWFHDAIYSSTSNDNELKSGLYCAKKLEELGISTSTIQEVKRLINLTKTHTTDQNDTLGKQLLDLDLAILGSNTDTYNRYVSNIRKEYSMYPTIIYNSGRKKVIEHFLSFDTIYLTNELAHLELQARTNLLNELKSL